MSEPSASPAAEPPQPQPLPPPPRRVEMRLVPLVSLWLLRALVQPLFAGVGCLFMGLFVIGVRGELERGVISGKLLLFAAGVASMLVWSYVAVVGGIKTFWLTPRRTRRILSHGQETIGTLMSKIVTETESSYSYGLTYSYTDTAGRKFTQQSGRVSFGLWKTLYEDQKVTVLYDPSRSENSILYEAADYVIKQ